MSENDRILFQGRYLALSERRGWEFVARHHLVVAMIAWTPEQELLLVEQYRIPIGCRTIELPAGLVGDEPEAHGEALLEAAARELIEETGWRAGRMRELISCPSSAGLSSEMVTFVLAEELEWVEPGGGDASEDIVVHRVPQAALDRWLSDRARAGLGIDPKIYAALYWSGRHAAAYPADSDPDGQ